MPKTIWSTNLDAIKDTLEERDVEIVQDPKREVQAQSKNKARTTERDVAAEKNARKTTRKQDGVSVESSADPTLFACLSSCCSLCFTCMP